MIEDEILALFPTVSLQEMSKVKLMNRIDSKFVTDISKIKALLRILKEGYRIQQIDGKLNMPYYTCYYDTSDNDMFYQHVRGKKTRQKIRKRLYEESMELPFLEVKHKNNKGRTKKKRVLMKEGEELRGYEDFLIQQSFYELNELLPCIENHFYRLTLVNNDMTERITIDTSIEFHNLINDEKISLPEIGIIEWKRDGVSCKSELGSILRELHIHESSFSKYCIGRALTEPLLKQNRLKEKIRMIQKIENKHL